MVTIDERIRTRKMLHYARVLVEVDLRKQKEEYIMYEHSGHCAKVSLGYENHPTFCSTCESLGHSTSDCSHVYGAARKQPSNPKIRQPAKSAPKPSTLNKNDESTKEWVIKWSTIMEQDGAGTAAILQPVVPLNSVCRVEDHASTSHARASSLANDDRIAPSQRDSAMHVPPLLHAHVSQAASSPQRDSAMQIVSHAAVQVDAPLQHESPMQVSSSHAEEWHMPKHRAKSPENLTFSQPLVTNSFIFLDPDNRDDRHTASDSENESEDFTNDPLDPKDDAAKLKRKKKRLADLGKKTFSRQASYITPEVVFRSPKPLPPLLLPLLLPFGSMIHGWNPQVCIPSHLGPMSVKTCRRSTTLQRMLNNLCYLECLWAR